MKFNFTTILLAITLVITSQNKINAQINKTDSLALVDLYNSTNGNNWKNHTNWLTASPVSSWYGIIVSGKKLKEILLEQNQMTGSLPASIGNFKDLTDLSFRSNRIGGSLPDSIGKLNNLKNLDLYFNNFSGTIPSTIGNLSSLGYLNISQNQLSGTIPATVFNLTNLLTLDLSRNKLIGEIPFSIGNLIYLQYLALFNNQLTGHIPESIGNCEILSNIFLDSNRLTGQIPASIIKLKHLSTLSLNYNFLSEKTNFMLPDGFESFAHINIKYNRFNFNGIEALAQPTRAFDYSPQRNIHAQASGNSLHVNAGGTLSNNTYTWYKFGETTGVTIAGDSIFHPTENGIYYVTVTNAIAIRLTLVSDTILYNARLVGVAQSNSKENVVNRFEVFPNPAKNSVNIQLPKASELVFIDAKGNILFKKYVDGKTAIDISNLSAGSYYIKNKLTGEVKNLQVIK